MERKVKDMAELLRKGAKMTSEVCPICSTPLFEMQGKVWCPSCRREVIVVPRTSYLEAGDMATILSLQRAILNKLSSLTEAIEKEHEMKSLREKLTVALLCIGLLEKTYRLVRDLLNRQAVARG